VNTNFTEATPEETQDVLKYTEDWFSQNSAIGRRVSWYSEDNPDPASETGLPSWAVRGAVASVAVDVAPYFGKEASQSTRAMAASGMQTINARTISTQRVKYPNRMPLGQGNGSTYGGKYYEYYDNIQTFNDFLEDDGGEEITE